MSEGVGFIVKNNKKLRCGYTTGSCAAGAAKGAAIMLFSGKKVERVRLETPKGILLELVIEETQILDNMAGCAVRKDSGDDPDVTDHLLVYAKVRKGKGEERVIHIEGGLGVGRVTRPGLDQPVGNAAINRVPREMIAKAVEEICEEFEYYKEIHVEISIPEGIEVAKKTFNPKLGIVGGISILGTSGIVEPMSDRAIIETIRTEIRQHMAMGEKLLYITPGNYGKDFLQRELLIKEESSIKCSNFVGETIAMALEQQAEGALFIAHIGKFIKVAGGIMNTHSQQGDARMEILSANILRSGAPSALARQVLDCNTTEEAMAILEKAGCLKQVMAVVMERIQFYLQQKTYDKMDIGAVVFSNQLGLLGKTPGADRLI